MKKQDLYNNILLKVKEALEKDSFEAIDYILEFVYSGWLPESNVHEIDDIMQEVTLYSEFKEIEYKETALVLIAEFAEHLNTK